MKAWPWEYLQPVLLHHEAVGEHEKSSFSPIKANPEASRASGLSVDAKKCQPDNVTGVHPSVAKAAQKSLRSFQSSFLKLTLNTRKQKTFMLFQDDVGVVFVFGLLPQILLQITMETEVAES